MKNHSSSPPKSGRPSPPTEAQIAALAHQYYLERGGDHGHDREDWLRAEKHLREQFTRAETSRDEPPQPVPSREIRPLDEREHPMARGRRGSATREEIRAQQIPIAARTH